ncbi:MAG TPA: PepSY-associated TM helix domain-containing protein [Parapedobacter sp.]|uniref:PepSY-associated TM helix domain-containing protein n=1 Tax=Parapedobacter sp. TaxID=1958893 RepID=UPI002B523E80|nr:PepSY-associated TM helix domain-containing protein [Parapedobacter sp.]HWK58246.1 PepSY-associated TM helix domain-containing protein [Parapedobacter sp.]
MEDRNRKKTPWQQTRKFFNDIHLWMGLISGLVVVAVCFSGTVYTYNTELTEWAASHLHKVDVPRGSERLPVEQLLPEVAAVAGGSVNGIHISADPARTYRFTVRKEGEQSRFGTTYYVNPYNGEVRGTSEDQSKTWVAIFMRDMFSLHRWLLLDRIEEPIIGELPNRTLGSYISGTATILFTLGVITGLVIWFPQKLRTWRQGLRVKWKASWKRVNHDLHNTLAFYSLILLFVMGITGPQWSFPWYREGLQKALGTYREAPTGGRSGNNAQRGGNDRPEEIRPMLPINRLLAATDEVLPYRGDYMVSLSGSGPVTIRKNKVGFFAPAASDEVKLNAATAEIEEVTVFREKPFNERIAGSIKALHIGNVYGQFTKLLYFLACLIATSLPITGTMIWLNKMKKKSSKRGQKKQRAVLSDIA